MLTRFAFAFPVLVLNSGWSINGAWSVLKRLLPASTLAKISFTTPKELVDRYFEADRLPTREFSSSIQPSCEGEAKGKKALSFSLLG